MPRPRPAGNDKVENHSHLADLGHGREVPVPVLRQNSVRRQVIHLSALIRRRSRLNGHSPAPPASTPPDALRRPPSGRPGEPRFAPPARRLQEDGEPAEVAQQRSAVLGRVVQGVGRLEAGSRHRVTQHRPAVAAPPLPRVLGQTLRSPRGGTPARKPPDQGSRRTNGSGQSSGARLESMANCRSWESRWPSVRSPGCSRSGAHRRPRRGGRSSPTMSGT